MVIMNIDLKIHRPNHIIKNLLGNIEYSLTSTKSKENELYVVNYHGTQQKFINNFRKQIEFFLKLFYIISPQELDLFYANSLKVSNKPMLLLTFDDGIKNNYYAFEVLKEHDLKAFIFVIPDFINTSVDKQKEYFLNHIRPNINPAIDHEAEDFCALSWDEIKTMQSLGYGIGSHTKTHQLVAKESSVENSMIEIQKSKQKIAGNLNVSLDSINSFCSINNTIESISNKELRLIKENYKYHFTTIPGPNLSKGSPFFIRRSNIELYWLLGAVKYSLGKWDLKRWKEKENVYLDMLNNENK